MVVVLIGNSCLERGCQPLDLQDRRPLFATPRVAGCRASDLVQWHESEDFGDAAIRSGI
jgi:hypothetical protein